MERPVDSEVPNRDKYSVVDDWPLGCRRGRPEFLMYVSLFIYIP